MDNLLIDGDAGRGGKGHAAGIALEEGLGVVLGEQGFHGAVDLDSLDARLDGLAANTQGAGDELAGLAHQADFAHRFELGGTLEKSQHGGLACFNSWRMLS